jgi:hypothetical protein
MKKLIQTIILIITATLTLHASEQQHLKVAILDLQSKKLSKIFVKGATVMLRDGLENSKAGRGGSLQIVSSRKIKKAMKKNEFKTCKTDQCYVNLGKHLQADKVVVGYIKMKGRGIVLELNVIDISKGMKESRVNVRFNPISKINAAINRAIKKLI